MLLLLMGFNISRADIVVSLVVVPLLIPYVGLLLSVFRPLSFCCFSSMLLPLTTYWLRRSRPSYARSLVVSGGSTLGLL